MTQTYIFSLLATPFFRLGLGAAKYFSKSRPKLACKVFKFKMVEKHIFAFLTIFQLEMDNRGFFRRFARLSFKIVSKLFVIIEEKSC